MTLLCIRPLVSNQQQPRVKVYSFILIKNKQNWQSKTKLHVISEKRHTFLSVPGCGLCSAWLRQKMCLSCTVSLVVMGTGSASRPCDGRGLIAGKQLIGWAKSSTAFSAASDVISGKSWSVCHNNHHNSLAMTWLAIISAEWSNKGSYVFGSVNFCQRHFVQGF